jgi:hypothetical protein
MIDSIPSLDPNLEDLNLKGRRGRRMNGEFGE